MDHDSIIASRGDGPVLWCFQALVNPLSVALKSPKQDRREAAKKLMEHMEQHSSGLVKVRDP